MPKIATDEQGETRKSESIRVNPMQKKQPQMNTEKHGTQSQSVSIRCKKIATDEHGETRNYESIRVNPIQKIATDEQGETRNSESIRVNPMQNNKTEYGISKKNHTLP